MAKTEPLLAESHDAGTARGSTADGTNVWQKASHALGPMGSFYDELYFQYCQRRRSLRRLSLDQLRRFPSADVMVDHARDWSEGLRVSHFFCGCI